MIRKIDEELLKWKKDEKKIPLFLYGTNSIGKTYSVLEFGNKNYSNIAYFNTFNNKELYHLLEKEKVLDKLIMKLSVMCGETILKGETLIVFDNISNAKLIKNLHIFNNEASFYPTIFISSNIPLVNKSVYEGFYYRKMYPMDFFEYLSNTDKAHLIDFIKDSYENNTKMPFHNIAVDTYYEYLETGGFPEVVYAKLNNQNSLYLDSIKKKILDIYRSNYSLFSNKIPFNKTEEIMENIPYALSKENKKFQYGIIKKGARSKDYELSITALVNNGIVNRSFRINNVKSPLVKEKDEESFKLYYNDVGLLYTGLFMNHNKLLTDNNLRKSLIENDIANTLIKLGYSIYYYQTEAKSEVEFIIQNNIGKIIPIELTSTKSSKSKILSTFSDKFNINEAIKITEDNFIKRKNTRLIPVYAICCLKDL